MHSVTRATMIRNGQDCLTQVSYTRIIRTVVVSNLTRSEKHFSFFEKSVHWCTLWWLIGTRCRRQNFCIIEWRTWL